ncbi:MAG: efflux RND transporter permease subunit, partial [Gemmatimonadetes bacterium]|nr:efflux RND transporter permease subunit [Gemmatimonadota bacterium]
MNDQKGKPTTGSAEGPVSGGAAGHGRVRYFWPTNLSVANRVSMAALIAITALMGILSYRSIPKEASPEITIPMISVTTVYPGVSPKDMETLVTRVIEDELNQVPEITELTSTSDMGYSTVTAEFDADMDMEAALQKVREKVDLARPELPADAEDPAVSEFNMADFPIMQVNIAGEYDLVRLKELAESVQDRLEQIPSILEVRLSGGLERVVRVDVDLSRLKFYNLAFDDVIDAIRFENVTVPGGSIEVGAQDFLVRVDGEFDDTRVIEDIVVLTKNGRPIYVRDIASVDFGFGDRRSYARLDGAPVVTLDIIKRSGRNIIETADAVKTTIAGMAAGFPPTTNVKVTSDQSERIRVMVSSLENNIISGLILVVAVLLFFLGVRNAVFVGLSIPLSMLLSFIIMKTLGITMNMVVLFSLILALGMLVDNAIVVVENIYRHLETGFDRFEAARRGAGEVAMPIITSTLTTLAAFFPLLFWPGLTGEFMSYLPQTLIITLASSLFVALVLIPSLCAVFMRVDGGERRPVRPAARWAMLGAAGLVLLGVASSNLLAAVTLSATAVGLIALHRYVLDRASRWFQDHGVVRIIARYEHGLRWALAHRVAVLGMAAVAFMATLALFVAFNAGSEYFPESIPPQTVYAQIDVAAGTTPDFTNDVAERLESQLHELDGIRDAESIVATVSGGSGGVVGMFSSSGGEGSVAVNFVDFEKRSTDVFETLAAMQQRLGEGIAGAEIKIEQQSMGPPSGPPVSIEIVGPDVEQLRLLSDSALAILKRSPVYAKLEGLESDMTRGRPELVVEVDRERAALYDLTTSDVGMTVRTAIQGSEAAKFRSGNDEYDIVVRLAEEYRGDLDALRDLTVVSEGNQIPLPSVASWRVEEGLGTVKRKDLDRVATIESDVRAGEQSNAVLAQVQRTLADFSASLPGGYAL